MNNNSKILKNHIEEIKQKMVKSTARIQEQSKAVEEAAKSGSVYDIRHYSTGLQLEVNYYNNLLELLEYWESELDKNG